jgi:tRNA-intron endonuclease, archaea type
MSASILSGTKVLIGDKDLKSQLNERGFGTNRGSAQEISLIEATFLVEEKTIEVSDGKRNLTLEDLIKVGNKIEDNFYAKYVVYADLRKRGLMVKTGLKFGSDFRVYERGATVKSGHSKQLVNVIPEEYSCSFPEIARAIRLSQNVNKAMIYAIVDEEGDVTYYQIDRIRL